METHNERTSSGRSAVAGIHAKLSVQALPDSRWRRRWPLHLLKGAGVLLACAVLSVLATSLFAWILPIAAAYIGPMALCATFLVGLFALAQYQHVASAPDEEHRKYQEVHEVA